MKLKTPYNIKKVHKTLDELGFSKKSWSNRAKAVGDTTYVIMPYGNKSYSRIVISELSMLTLEMRFFKLIIPR